MKSMILLVPLLLAIAVLSPRTPAQETSEVNCEALLEQAETYDITNDSRAEAAFRTVALAHGKKCPEVFLKLSMNLSHSLKFNEAAEMLRVYRKLVPKSRANDDQDLQRFEKAAKVQERIANSPLPSLDDLLDYTRYVRAYGRKPYSAIPYAEKAVQLYPDAVEAILLLLEVLPPRQAQEERVEHLLNRAATIEPSNSTIYTTRGWWNLHTFRRSDDAEKYFRQALLVSNDSDPTAWKGLGYVFMERGKKHDAIRFFRRSLRLESADPEIIRVIESLERNPN
ncbi:MAG TPA: hypothetical protein VJU84_18515 [Pyrinomonadaceae bacterium]|nr:hypothetical protein [Pyrinomonadaceae bacterium]